ncbi:MAG: hypothetical protein ABIM40_02060, partial [Pseudomonadota bacterium]
MRAGTGARAVFAAALVLAALFSGGCREKALTVQPPEDRPLYGCTPAAEFFVHESMVRELDAGDPSLVSPVTEWEPRDMERRGEYWVYACPQGKDLDLWNFYQGFSVEYQFRVGKLFTIPNKKFNKLGTFGPQDVAVRADVGFVFMTKPRENPFLP